MQSPDGWPDDAVEISEEKYQALLAGQTQGKIIVPDEKGYPVLADPLPPTPEQYIAEAEREKRRLMQTAIETTKNLEYAVELTMASTEEKAALAAWKKYRVLLARVDTSGAPGIDWPAAPVSPVPAVSPQPS